MTELPTEVGSYTITYTVAETKNYTGLTATVQFEIKAPEVVEPEEPGDDPLSQIPTIPAEWGYVKTDLGDLHNEVAVVFTNHVDKAMSWTVPADIENVQFLVVGGGGGGGGAVNSTKGGAGGAGGGGGIRAMAVRAVQVLSYSAIRLRAKLRSMQLNISNPSLRTRYILAHS
jgi:hypothetical protein